VFGNKKLPAEFGRWLCPLLISAAVIRLTKMEKINICVMTEKS
jgi:hypothetical protein